MSFDVKNFLNEFECCLQEILGSSLDKNSPISDAVRYAVFGGGKRVRPTAVYLGAQSTGRDYDIQQVLTLAAAVELIHSYSLVHDDLPAMDNDDYRRGRLSTHKKFGEANGILTGDQLLTLAMRLLTAHCGVYGGEYIRAAEYLAAAAQAMADGQALDLARPKSGEDFLAVYRLKTGAMIKAAFTAGAAVAGAAQSEIDKIQEFGDAVGLAFQLADDLLDEGEQNSFVGVKGRAEAFKLLEESTSKAVDAAASLPNGDILAEFAKKLAGRKY